MDSRQVCHCRRVRSIRNDWRNPGPGRGRPRSGPSVARKRNARAGTNRAADSSSGQGNVRDRADDCGRAAYNPGPVAGFARSSHPRRRRRRAGRYGSSLRRNSVRPGRNVTLTAAASVARWLDQLSLATGIRACDIDGRCARHSPAQCCGSHGASRSRPGTIDALQAGAALIRPEAVRVGGVHSFWIDSPGKSLRSDLWRCFASLRGYLPLIQLIFI